MIKKIMPLVFIALLIAQPILGVANLGTKKVTEFVGWDLICLDSNGIDAKPDSAHLFTRLDAGSAIQFKTRSTTFPFDGIGVDTAKEYGDTTWSYSDQIDDIDGDPTPPTYVLQMDLVLWNSKIATHNRAVVQVIADSLNEATAGSIASLKPTVAGRTFDVAATGEGGVDWGNILGTLDAGEIGTDAITATKIEANAIGASELAANAIGASEIANDAFDSLAFDDTWWEKLANVSDSGATGPSPWSSGQRDSVLNAIADANLNDKVTKIFSTAQRDSLLNTILDANKGNYKATGFSTHNAGDIFDVDIETAHGTDATAGLLLRVLGKDLSNAPNDISLLQQFHRVLSIMESQRGSHSHIGIGGIFYVNPEDGASHASGARGGHEDPYASIQDAHDNAVTDNNHDIILLVAGSASGITTLTEDVTLTKRFLQIRGPGPDFLWTRSGAGNTITITGDGIGLEGFQVNTAVTGSGNGIDVIDADNILINNLVILDTRGDGIHMLRCNSATISNNRFIQSGMSGSGQGIDISGTAGTSNDIRIINNFFRDVSGDAITISGGTTNDVVIRTNIIEESAGWGINIGASSTDAFITDNRLGNNSSGNILNNGTTTIILNNEQWGKADSLQKLLDTIYVFSPRIDSLLDALADANLDDKITKIFNTTQRDSLLAALADANLDDKVTKTFTTTQRDSLLAALADANMDDKLTKIFSTTQRDSILNALADANFADKFPVFDSLDYDATFWEKLANVSDSGAAGGSSPWNTTQRDSVLAALSDANMGDKIPLGGGASPWTVAQRDSLLNVITDAVFRNKVLGDSLTTPATLERLLIDGGSLVGHDGFSRLFTFVDSANADAPINQLPVFLNNEAQTMLQPYNGLTDANGNITFNVAAGTYTVYHTSEIWVSFLDTIVVSGTGSQSIDLFTDVSANHAVILGFIGGVGQFPNGSVEVTLSTYDASVQLIIGDTLYGQNMKSYPADANGKFEVPAIQTDIFGSDSAFYKFAFKDQNGRRVRVGGERHIFVSLDSANVTAGVANFNSLTRVNPE